MGGCCVRRMPNRKTLLVLAAFVLLLTFLFFYIDGKKNSFGLEQLVNEMKHKGYEVEVVNASMDFLSGSRKRIKTGDEVIDVYQYVNNFFMERDAKGITPEGSGYDGLLRKVRVSWVGPPHFYKKGKIIVQYIGDNKKITSDLKDILGEPFAGYR
jgi:hypothetical protein